MQSTPEKELNRWSVTVCLALALPVAALILVLIAEKQGWLPIGWLGTAALALGAIAGAIAWCLSPADRLVKFFGCLIHVPSMTFALIIVRQIFYCGASLNCS